MRMRLVAVLVTASTIFGLVAGTPPADAATKHHHTVAQAVTYLKGKWTTGPNTYTKWQRIQLTGFVKGWDCVHNRYAWNPQDVMHQYRNPTTAPALPSAAVARAATGGLPALVHLNGEAAPATTCTIPPGVVSRDASIHPDSWYNPASWNWGHILSKTWNAIWNHCLSGATQGVVGTASGTLVINLLARGGKVFVGPEGYAAIAIGGCVVNLVW
jgi:hypothetical protein